MPRATKSRTSSPRFPYLYQLTTALAPVPQGQITPFSDVFRIVRDNADVYGPNIIGTRFEPCAINHFRTLRSRQLIEADFEQRSLRVTPTGRRKFQAIQEEIRDSNADRKAELMAYFLASKKIIGPSKGLTKSEMGILLDRQERKIGEQERTIGEQQLTIGGLRAQVHRLPDEVVRRVDLLNAAGPSTSNQIFNTPPRKSMSMGPYLTPESLPRLAAPLFRPLPQAPPPSPSPRGSFAMDVDEPTESGHRDLHNVALEHSRPQLSIPEDEAQLQKIQDELAILSATYQDCEKARKAATAALEELQDDVSFLRSMQELTEEEDNAFRLDMDDFITELENKKGALEQDKVDLQNKVHALEADKTRSEEWRVKLVEDAAKLTAALSAGFPADQ
ncbi:hypothetical protein B0H13DRAFT_1950269 [Mycena leptocephala]|nr:hypothetical protein B0H13DRAFT_1950269 [Mycena leptocephala]